MFKKQCMALAVLMIFSGAAQLYLYRERRVEKVRSLRFLDAEFDNLKNQFTPGFKSWHADAQEYLAHGKSTFDMSRGKLCPTQCRSDLAVDGWAFFILKKGGGRVYTRDGRFQFHHDYFCSQEGDPVLGRALDDQGRAVGKLVPFRYNLSPLTKLYFGEYTGFRIDETGVIFGEQIRTDPVTGQSITCSTPLFKIALARFDHPENLKAAGVTAFTPTDLCGDLYVGWAGERDLGAIRSGYLELSNTDYMAVGCEIAKMKTWISCETGQAPPPPPPIPFCPPAPFPMRACANPPLYHAGCSFEQSYSKRRGDVARHNQIE